MKRIVAVLLCLASFAAFGADAPKPFWQLVHDDPVALFTGIIAIFTIGLFIAGAWQVRVARDTGRRQLRAYLVVYPGRFVEQDNVAQRRAESQPFVKNVGQTPAYDVTVNSQLALFPYPLPPNHAFPLPPMADAASRTVIAPNIELFLTVNPNRMFTDPETEIIKTVGGGAFRLYTYGTVTYKDIFGITHITEYCHSTVWGTAGFPAGNHSNQHNTAT